MSNPVNSLNSVMHICIGFIGNIQLCILASVILKLGHVERVRILQKIMTYSIDSCCSKQKNTVFYFAEVWDFYLTFFLSKKTLWITVHRRYKVWIIRVSSLFFIWKKNNASPEERIWEDWEKKETMKCWSLWWVQIYSVNVYNWLRKKRNGEIVITWVAKKVKCLWFCKIPGKPPSI